MDTKDSQGQILLDLIAGQSGIPAVAERLRLLLGVEEALDVIQSVIDDATRVRTALEVYDRR